MSDAFEGAPDRSVRGRIARGLRSAWIRHATRSGAGATARFDGLLATLTGLPDETLNVAFVEDEPADAARALRDLDAWFTAQGRRVGLDLERGRHPEVERAAAVFGLRRVVSRPAMALAGAPGMAPGRASRVEVVETTDPADVDAARAIQSSVFRLDPEVTRRYLSDQLLADEGYRLYLARLDGEPAGSAGVHLDGDTAGIFGVCTLPALRRRGVGAALTMRCLDDAVAAGADLAWLQATPEGFPLYDRLGFVAVSDWDVWTR